MKFSSLPIWPFILAAVVCLTASVAFTAQDSNWRWAGFAGAAVFVGLTAFGFVLKNAPTPGGDKPGPSGIA